ncbi:Suppressor of kinetochore protein 1 [Aphelenchoides avenae]|nr:Suppressor of kinetochore protein 1 [Aphelenchus avenae]
MNASNINNAAAPRQVACETSDNAQMPVDLDVLCVSGTFKRMYEDLGMEEHDVFPGVFPLKTVNSRTFNKVMDWCKEHKNEPDPVVEKEPLTHECKWFTLADDEKTFFGVPVPELLELAMAADYLDIPRLYHYACQSVAALIKGKLPGEICGILMQNCDLDDDQIRKALDDDPWLDRLGAFSGALIENAIFISNELLLTIFEKLPREDLESLQLVSAQFNDVIVSSSALSAHQGPLRVVTKVEFGAYSRDRCSQRTDVWLCDGTVVSCPDYENLVKRLKFSVVQKLRIRAEHGAAYAADVEDLSALLPVKAVWKNATVKASMACFPSAALFEFVFTQLLLCKEIVFSREGQSLGLIWSSSHMRLPAIVACNKLDISRLFRYEDRNDPADVVEWLEHEILPETKWSEPRQMIIDVGTITGGIDGQLTALKTAFTASISAKAYVVHLRHGNPHGGIVNEVLKNVKTYERLSIRAGQSWEVIVERT